MTPGGTGLPDVQFKEARRGYDKDQVERFRRAAMEAIEGYEDELARLQEQLTSQSVRLAELAAAEEAVRRTFISAGQVKAEMLTEAEMEAERLRTEAQRESHAERTTAQREVEELRTEARGDTDQLRAVTQREVDELLTSAKQAVRERTVQSERAADELRKDSEGASEKLRKDSEGAAEKLRKDSEGAAAQLRADSEATAAQILSAARARAEAADTHTKQELTRLDGRIAQLRGGVGEVKKSLRKAVDAAAGEFELVEQSLEQVDTGTDDADGFASPPSLES
jgi:chromosome segregation ATPase